MIKAHKEGEPDEYDAMSIAELTMAIAEIEQHMLKWAELLEFEKAAVLRDEVKQLNKKLTKKLKAEGIGMKGKAG